jgi:hypothetical protein
VNSAEVEAIGACEPASLRNLRITQAYHEIAVRLVRLTGPGANWCALATWASRQAGRTMRAEDLGRKIEEIFEGSDAVSFAITRLRGARRVVGRALGRQALIAAIREACMPLLTVGRVAEAVGRGNKKVFDEIGLVLARFVERAPGPDGAAAVERLCASLQPGEPPAGQRLLAAALRDYHVVPTLATPKARAERLLLANLRIGMHEQTRLQPEIADALNAPVLDPGEVRQRLLIAILGSERAASHRVAAQVGSAAGLDQVAERLVERLRAAVRAVVTEELMTIALPAGPRRLGGDLQGAFPASLATLESPALIDLLRAVDPTADSTLESGARDWAVMSDRMHFIADLFRLEHDTAALFEPPFTLAQREAIAAGRVPDGEL